MIKAISIGHSSYDIYIQVGEFPKEKADERFINKLGCGGGTAANVSYLLGKWGISSTFSGVMGNDVFGSRALKELQSVGVDTRYVETSYEKDTSISFTLVNTTNGEPTIFNVADEYVKLKKFDFDFQPDIIFIDGHDPYAQKTTIDHFPKTTTVMYGKRFNNETVDLCRKSKYMICNLDFAQKATKMQIDYNNTSTLATLYDELHKKFDQQIIIITLSEHGALYSLNDQIKVSPAIKVNIVDKSARGDIFAGALTYGIAQKWDIERSIKYANIAAGLSIMKNGGRISIPKLDEVSSIYEKNN